MKPYEYFNHCIFLKFSFLHVHKGNMKLALKQPKCPLTFEWMKKMQYIYIIEKNLSLKKEWNNTICSNMDGPRVYCTNWSKSEKERQVPYDIAYIWNLRYSTSELIFETDRFTDVENRIVVAKGVGRWEKDWEFGISIFKLLYVKWINKKVLLCSTGSYIHNWKELWKRICIHIHMYNWITAV